jgi:uncharacterized protein
MSTTTRSTVNTTMVGERLATVDWNAVSHQLQGTGYATVNRCLTPDQCAVMRELYEQPHGYRKTVVMERFRFGRGEYKYFDYPLPGVVQTIRSEVYPRLVPVANTWMEQLRIQKRFPQTLHELIDECHHQGQRKPTPLILTYRQGGFNTLHQDLYGEVYFPLQAVILLSEPDTDFTGGEFVLTQQNLRAQSKAIVLRPRIGDMVIFTTNFRPVASRSGFYRAAMKHGVSEVTSGERYTLGIIFHDALN